MKISSIIWNKENSNFFHGEKCHDLERVHEIFDQFLSYLLIQHDMKIWITRIDISRYFK